MRGEVRSRTDVLPPHFTIAVAEPDIDGAHTILHEDGRFLMTAFPPGDYTMEISRFGKLGLGDSTLAREKISITGNMNRLVVWIP